MPSSPFPFGAWEVLAGGGSCAVSRKKTPFSHLYSQLRQALPLRRRASLQTSTLLPRCKPRGVFPKYVTEYPNPKSYTSLLADFCFPARTRGFHPSSINCEPIFSTAVRDSRMHQRNKSHLSEIMYSLPGALGRQDSASSLVHGPYTWPGGHMGPKARSPFVASTRVGVGYRQGP